MKNLRLHNRAVRRLKEAHGIDLYSNGLAAVDLQAEGLAPFVKIYWAGRLHESPDLTLEAAQDESDEFTAGELMTAVTAAVRNAFGVTATPEARPEADSTDKSFAPQ